MVKHTQQEPVQLLQLTSLRFFAALAVLFSHLGFLRSVDNPIKPIADTFFHEGYSGVSFFFVLSGFILCYTYQNLIAGKTISSKKYILLRLSRIYPLHFFTALPFIFYLLYKQTPDYITSIALNITLLQSWIPISKYYFSLNAISWSLSVELFFYTSFIFLAQAHTKTLIKIASTWLIIIGITAAAMIYTSNGSWAENGELKISHWLFYINPVVRLLDFIVGMLIYRLTFVKKKRGSTTLNEIASVLLLLIGMYVFSTYNFPEVLRAQLLYLPLISYVIYSFSSGNGLISKCLKGKNIVLLGEASFSLYMIHQPIITVAYMLYQKIGLTLSLVTFSALLTVFCVLASVMTFKVIEKPIHEYLKQKIKALN
jgi:peptidoglycan/LPS O-acetylase OafA/YrhL